jgi:hypothetical protein
LNLCAVAGAPGETATRARLNPVSQNVIRINALMLRLLGMRDRR